MTTAETPNETPLWERQPGESCKAFACFKFFRDLPPEKRSIRAAYRQKTGNENARQASGDWNALAIRWRWVERVLAWDDEQDRLLREKKIEAIQEMAERHAAVASIFIQHLVNRLARFDPADLSPSDMQKWFEVAVKIERLSRGEPTEIQTRDAETEVREVIVRSRQEAAEFFRLHAQNNGTGPGEPSVN
jgi:hypothetical protein